MDEDKAAETIRRLSRLLGVAGEDISILQHPSRWSKQNLADLTDVVRSYMSFQTLDVKEQKRGFSQIINNKSKRMNKKIPES